MAVVNDDPPAHVGKTARKVAKAAGKKGGLRALNADDAKRGAGRKPRAPRKVRVETTFAEAGDLQERSDRMIGTDEFRLRGLASARILYLFTSAEKITGCLDGILKAGRYPRMFRYKPALKYDFLLLVARPQWDRASDEERTRIAYHGLRHMGSDTAGRWHTEAHDHEGFYAEVEYFGLRSPEIKRIAEQLDLFQHRALKPSEKKQEGG